MSEIFRNYLFEKSSLTEQEIELIQTKSIERSITKKEIYLNEGEVCRYATFIIKGCMRVYKIDGEGNEYILRFAVENWWISDRESYVTGKPSKFMIDALENSKVLAWKKGDFESLLKKLPAFKEFSENLLAKSFHASQNRIYSNISLTTEEKYLNFIETYPDIFNRVPLHLVASYLGVTRETLSRVRRKFARK